LSDKDFKVKNKLVLNGLTQTGPLVADSNKQVDATPYLTTLQGGTGTTTSPTTGQIPYSTSGTTYTPTAINTLDVKGSSYSADAPSNPVVGQIWVESDTTSDSFDPNIIRRKSFTATAAQTVFTTDLEFIQGYEQVFFNGMLLLRNSDYTTASNTNVTLASGAAVGDIVEIVSITNLNSINTVATTGANTITSTTASTIPLTIQGAASQTSDLLRLTNNSGQILANHNGSTLNLKTSTFPALTLTRYGTEGASAGIDFIKSNNATLDTDAAVALDSKLFDMRSIGYDGLAYGTVATSISGWVDGAVSSGSIPGRLVFATSGVERLRINSSGNISSLFNQSFANSSYAGKNVIINGAMDIWQRGTSFPSGVGLGSGTVYSADRWHWYRGSNDSGATLTRQSAGLSGFQYCIRMQRNSGNTSTQSLGLRYTAETADSVRFAGKSVTLSFWARKGANYSGSSNTFRATVATGTGTDQVVHSFTGFTYIVDQNVTLTDNWQRFTLTGTAASNITQIGLEMFHNPVAGTAGANDYMEITGIQLEEGSIATPFSRSTGTTQGELAACQRYFQILGDNIYELIYGGYMTSGTIAYISFPFPVTMRTTPVGTIVGGWAVFNTGQPIIQATFPHTISLRATSTATGQFYFHSNTTYYLTMNAEL
jgi:hypothetical protein